MRTYGALAGLAAAGIWGGMYVVSKVVLDVIPPFTLLSLRLLIGAACLAPFLAHRPRGTLPLPRLAGVALTGLIGYGLSLGMQFLGTKLSTAANASLVTSASPAFMVAFAAPLLGERVTPRRLFALGLATAGVLAVIDPRSAQIDAVTFQGNLILFGAATTWALYSVLIRRASFELDTLSVSFLAVLGGLIVSLPLSVPELGRVDLGRFTPRVLLGVLYLGVISTALAMYLWNKSLALLETGVVSLFFFAQPVVGSALGALLLGEALDAGFWLGAALIGLGLLSVSRSPLRAPLASKARPQA